LAEPWREITEEDLHAYVDGALDGARRLDVALYLAISPIEAARVESFRAQKEGIHALFDEVIVEPLPKRLRRLMVRRTSLRMLRRSMPFIAMASFGGLLLLAANAVGHQLASLQNALMGARPAAAHCPVIAPPSPAPLPARRDT
jgi:anti-sigma factor RsiW